jgi:chromosome segregation ATPase
MRLRSLSVQNFGAVESAEVSFEDGLNVLHGPNDLGKSTLAAAIRAALLLQHGSSGARPFIPWGTTCKPTVTLVLEIDGRLWRVHKVFGSSSGGKSVLEWSNDGTSWSVQEEGRGVDGHLRSLLRWGLAAPGGRGGAHGFPKSFLATVLLGEQAVPYRLLSQSLDGDAEDTGKTRLIEALQAMATDPLYQQVLLEAQERVDEAFTAKGKRSTRKGSPFERVTAEIKARRETSEQLTAQVAESDAVVSRLGDLSVRRDRAMTERAEAARVVERIDAALAQAQERATLQAEVDAAAAALQEIQRNQQEMARLQAALSEAKAAVPKAEAEVDAAAAAVKQSQEQHTRATAASEALQRGDDPEQRAAAQARAEATRVLDAEAETLAAAEAKLGAWRAAIAETSKADTALAAAKEEADETAEALVRAESDKQAAEAAHHRLKDATLWARADRLASRLDVLSERAMTAQAAKAEAAATRAKAEALQVELMGDFPDANACAAIEDAWATLQMREATLRGGFRVALDLSVDATAEVDGASAPVERNASIDAEREVVLRLPEVGSITVRPGDPGSHAALEVARAAWDAHAASLEAVGISTVQELRDAVRAREAKAQERTSLLRDADVLEAKAAPPDPEELESVRRDLDSARRAAENVDATASRALAQEHGDDLDAAMREAEAEANLASGVYSAAVGHAKDVETQHKLAAQTAEAAAKQEEAARVEGDDVEAAAATLARKLDTVAKRRAELEAQSKAEADAVAERKRAAAEAVAQAESALAAASDAETNARASLEQARAAATSATAALEVRRDQAEHHDAFAAAERVARAEDALAAHPAPTEDLGDERVASLRESLQRAEEALEDAERAVRQQEGALQQVGGAVVRERAQMAREALEDAIRQEAEVALDYDGWRLLLGTLREVENETGAHLGRALDEELAGRLESLSRGRYRGAALGADLETEGVVTSQGIQALDRFSEGVKEQVATLLRVSVAEHLDTALLLDDHLAQTDPGRAEWFSRLLRESAAGVQVVVLTCRPGDYLAGPEDGVHVVDLAAVVKRA